MKKAIIISSIVIGIVFLIFVLPVVLVGYKISHEIEKVKDSFGYSNEDIIAYVEKEHGFTVEILSNEGRDPGSKGLRIRDARVRQMEGDQLEFDISINTFGKITGDNYEEIKQRFDLNQIYHNSELFHDLQQFGFHELSFGKEADDPQFYIALPKNRNMADQETLQMLFEAIPLFEKLQAEVSKKGYELEEISVQGADLVIDAHYQSPQDLGNQLAARNISKFVYQFIEDDQGQVQKILPQLQSYGFNNDNNQSLQCDEIVEYEQCYAYGLNLYPNKNLNDNHDFFRYDDENDRENLFKAIREINTVELPIKRIVVHHVYSPNNPDDQFFTEKELETREKVSYFARRTVEVVDFASLERAEDIEFVY
ncbi:hypothetical protein [Lederbergia galactosidilytica]|uniref:Uncharacterized protein n=1 Tax=Lederbergia galactosidilytica TaxID=217031 RepID=A0A178A6E7_9BACI|nr:hypothetical protein [Lederbergia galactosidilytica]KRG14334.1 hypothetical protein ACA30_12270 [Virgibacillus soli]MBP1914435.1 hypothetical protein [Lederbergia galactosidilytica]OAK75767.1 hypothetical protein ABB05_01035 [Lederbergia galactosidilytica]